MAASVETYLEPQQMCDYVLLRHVNVGKDAENDKLYKKWTKLWVVVHIEVSPLDCYVGYCKKESNWLNDNQAIVKYALSDFTVSMMSTKKHDKVMRLDFPSLSVEMSFESQTKLDHYFQLLNRVCNMYHVDLVRAPSHPDREGDYIIEDCSEFYNVWKAVGDKRGKLSWVWYLRTIRRIHYQKNVEKLEIEAGRLSETGEGHFFFTGRHAFRLFEAMKTELMARAQQKQQTQNKSLPSSLDQIKPNLGRSSSAVGSANLPLSPLYASGGLPPARACSPLQQQQRSHSNGALPVTSAPLEGSDTSSEDYYPSDNSSSFTGTGGSICDWTTPSPVPSVERIPPLPPRSTNGRPFSPSSSTTSSSSSSSVYNVPRHSLQGHLSLQPHYMSVNREQVEEESDYMTMQHGVTRLQLSSEKMENEEEEYTDVSCAKTTPLHTAPGKVSSEFADMEYMQMIPIGDSQTATLTRSRGEVCANRSTSTAPPLPPHASTRLREFEILDSPTATSNTFPGTLSTY